MRISVTRYPEGLEQAAHAHERTTFSLVLAGALRERVGRREVTAAPFSIVVKPAGTVHDDVFGDQGATLVQVALDIAESRRLASEPSAHSLSQWRWSHLGPATPAFMQLAFAARCESAQSDKLEALAWDALAALGDASCTGQHAGPPSWIVDVRAQLDECRPAPRARALADAAGVHPIYLARQFRRFFGCSMSTYAQRVRLRRVAACMRRPGSLSRVALEAGFSDQPHLCRMFRREIGVTPRAYRAMLTDRPSERLLADRLPVSG